MAAVLSISVVVGTALIVAGGAGEAQQVVIESDEGLFVYPIDAERSIAVSGPIGDTIVHIHDGAAAVTESPCRDKICIAAGHLNESGQWAACLPNRVFVRVSGAEGENAIDAQTY